MSQALPLVLSGLVSYQWGPSRAHAGLGHRKTRVLASSLEVGRKWLRIVPSSDSPERGWRLVVSSDGKNPQLGTCQWISLTPALLTTDNIRISFIGFSQSSRETDDADISRPLVATQLACLEIARG